MKRFGAALSEHPLPTHAIGEVVGEVAEQVGEKPDLAVLFVTAPSIGVVEEFAGTVREVLKPETLIGTSAISVIGGGHEAENVAAVSLWAGQVGPVEPVRMEAQRNPDGWELRGVPYAEAGTMLLLPDPFTFPADGFLEQMARDRSRLAIVGGLASAARGPGGNRLVLNDQVFTDGAVGAVLGPNVPVRTVVSQGCRPIGDPFTVTASDGNAIIELGGKPASERIEELVAGLSPEDRVLASQGLHLGIVFDEHKLDFGRGDFLIRGVLGLDRSRKAVVVGDMVEVGATVQFQVRDADSADEDLRELMAEAGRSQAALTFTCNGRGQNLFGTPDHDAIEIHDAIGGAPHAGMFCAGEIGPVANRNQMHGFTASVLLFD